MQIFSYTVKKPSNLFLKSSIQVFEHLVSNHEQIVKHNSQIVI